MINTVIVSGTVKGEVLEAFDCDGVIKQIHLDTFGSGVLTVAAHAEMFKDISDGQVIKVTGKLQAMGGSYKGPTRIIAAKIVDTTIFE